ncbi:hypothetical protein MWH28_09620 [Natroniella sulfidigena]|uniref:hypothetical protein n=1 Tax=Natroniella sulfidigena TaxID=723921 RepID=UPI00200A3DE2|nr:hypothetical protein [Natroniella sulfidigena]MCK8817615.1 hypothetical protein [Natroniella sulfidigena]
MQIISVRKGFTADHSSTSYEFLAVDKPLEQEARDAVSSLSSRAHPSRRRVDFTYNVDGYDIPGGWEPLLKDYYDVMYSESYDWWTLGIAFDISSKEQEEELVEYNFRGTENLGVDIEIEDGRAIISIYACLDYSYLAEPNQDWSVFANQDLDYESEDYLLTLLTAVRKQIMKGNYDLFYAIWEVYGIEDYPLDKPDDYDKSDSVIKTFASILDCPF